jgi:hypothetical protein
MDNTIITDGSTIDNNCTKCIFFHSFQEIYTDELEPWDYGSCSEFDELVSVENVCSQIQKHKVDGQ